MEYISTKEASAKWGISTIRITILANEGRIPGAKLMGKNWLIPVNATKPPERKSSRKKDANKKEPVFSFPLYHFRPDWYSIQAEQFSKEQQILFTGTDCSFGMSLYRCLRISPIHFVLSR